MPAAQPISIFVRVAGVWKRVDPPHVKVSGVWKECTGVFVKVSGSWKRCFADIANEIKLTNRTVIALDSGSPFFAEAGLRWNGDGSIDQIDEPGGNPDWTDVATWRPFDMGRNFEIKFTKIFGSIDTEPTLNTWLNLTDPSTTHTWYTSISGIQSVEVANFKTEIREKITAPAVGDGSSTHTVQAETGTL